VRVPAAVPSSVMPKLVDPETWKRIAAELRVGRPVRDVAANAGVSASTITRRRKRDLDFDAACRRTVSDTSVKELRKREQRDRHNARRREKTRRASRGLPPLQPVQPERNPETGAFESFEATLARVDAEVREAARPKRKRRRRPWTFSTVGTSLASPLDMQRFNSTPRPALSRWTPSDPPDSWFAERERAREVARENVRAGLSPQGFACVKTPRGSTSFDARDPEDVVRAVKVIASEVGLDEAQRLVREAVPA